MTKPVLNLNAMITESRNPASEKIDELSTLEMLKVINQQDQLVALAVEKELPQIARAVDAIVSAYKKGGRLIYMGAGTSGRLGILDASECPPTYGTPAEQVVGLIAGGHPAILKAVENAEDNEAFGVQDLKNEKLTLNDVVVGIAASGRTPYVNAGLVYANSVGATTVSISCNPDSIMAQTAQIAIAPIVGPEVVTGSSRMKAGTAQKLILNMLTTGSMIRSGKVYGNLMVDVQASNLKLIERQKRIVMQATECSYEIATEALNQCNNHCKTAIVMVLMQCDATEASAQLKAHDGFIKQTIIAQ